MIAENTKISINTRKTRVLFIISIFAIGALLLVLFLHFRYKNPYSNDTFKEYEAVLMSETISIPVSIADEPLEQEIGLSGTKILRSDTGKLFVFKTPAKPGFWMKDMAYSLDIIWLDQDLKILEITKDISPNSYPKIFYPKENILYALEVNAGFSTKYGLKEKPINDSFQ